MDGGTSLSGSSSCRRDNSPPILITPSRQLYTNHHQRHESGLDPSILESLFTHLARISRPPIAVPKRAKPTRALRARMTVPNHLDAVSPSHHTTRCPRHRPRPRQRQQAQHQSLVHHLSHSSSNRRLPPAHRFARPCHACALISCSPGVQPREGTCLR